IPRSIEGQYQPSNGRVIAARLQTLGRTGRHRCPHCDYAISFPPRPSIPSRVMAMPPKPTSLMIAISMPSHRGEQDEDSLNREHGNDGDDDIATEAIVSILQHLQHGKASAVRLLRQFSAALDDMCEAFMAKDYHAVGDAADAARDAL